MYNRWIIILFPQKRKRRAKAWSRCQLSRASPWQLTPGRVTSAGSLWKPGRFYLGALSHAGSLLSHSAPRSLNLADSCWETSSISSSWDWSLQPYQKAMYKDWDACSVNLHLNSQYSLHLKKKKPKPTKKPNKNHKKTANPTKNPKIKPKETWLRPHFGPLSLSDDLQGSAMDWAARTGHSGQRDISHINTCRVSVKPEHCILTAFPHSFKIAGGVQKARRSQQTEICEAFWGAVCLAVSLSCEPVKWCCSLKLVKEQRSITGLELWSYCSQRGGSNGWGAFWAS